MVNPAIWGITANPEFYGLKNFKTAAKYIANIIKIESINDNDKIFVGIRTPEELKKRYPIREYLYH